MNTTIQATGFETAQTTTKVISKVKSAFWENAEYNRFGISPAILTIVVCISSFAAAFAIMSGVTELALVGFPTALFISSIIAIAPMRIIFLMAAICILIDLSIITLHLI